MHLIRFSVALLGALTLLTSACSTSGSSKTPGSAGDAGATYRGPAADGGVRPVSDAGEHAMTSDAGRDAAAQLADAGGSTPPGSFMLGQPQLGDSDVSLTPALSWSRASGATHYTVELATAPSFEGTDLVSTTDVTSTSLTPTAALKPGIVYYWRVKAVNSAGSSGASNAPFWLSSPVNAGSSPHGVAITPDGKTAVVANAGNPGGATFVDLKTFTAEAISFSDQASSQPGVVRITPNGATVLVVQLNNVLLLDPTSRMVTKVFSSPCVGTTLYDVALKPDSSAAIMPDFNAGCTADTVDVIALPEATLKSAHPLGTSATAFGVAVTPDGATALITRGVTATSMRRIDLNNGTVTTIANTSSTYGVAVTSDGVTALATSGSGDTVKVISLDKNSVTDSIDYASNTDVANIAIAPNGKTAVVVGDFDVGILDVPGKKVLAKLPGTGRSVAVTPDGKRALFSGAGASGKLHVIPLP